MLKRENFIDIDTKELNNLLKEDSKKIIYIGRPTCPGCVRLEPVLDNILKEENIKAYYYNTKTAREKELEEFEYAIEDLNALYIPLILCYEGDKEIDRLEYYDFLESEDNVNKFVKNVFNTIY